VCLNAALFIDHCIGYGLTINNLMEAAKKFNLNSGFILTLNQEDEISTGGIKISILPVWEWMLG